MKMLKLNSRRFSPLALLVAFSFALTSQSGAQQRLVNPAPGNNGKQLGVYSQFVQLQQQSGGPQVQVNPGAGQQTPRYGMLVTGTVPNSPAQKAGLEYGDVIVQANGFTIQNRNSLQQAIQSSGSTMTLRVINVRNGQYVNLPITFSSPGSIPPVNGGGGGGAVIAPPSLVYDVQIRPIRFTSLGVTLADSPNNKLNIHANGTPAPGVPGEAKYNGNIGDVTNMYFDAITVGMQSDYPAAKKSMTISGVTGSAVEFNMVLFTDNPNGPGVVSIDKRMGLPIALSSGLSTSRQEQMFVTSANGLFQLEVELTIIQRR